MFLQIFAKELNVVIVNALELNENMIQNLGVPFEDPALQQYKTKVPLVDPCRTPSTKLPLHV